MTKEEILAFAERNPVFALATIDAGKPKILGPILVDEYPHVRMMMLAMVEDGELIFCTGRDKDVNVQMTVNPAVEMCFYSQDEGVQVRIAGKVKEIRGEGIKKRIVEKFEFLKPWVEAEGLDVLATYRLTKARATTWTMETNFEPKHYI